MGVKVEKLKANDFAFGRHFIVSLAICSAIKR